MEKKEIKNIILKKIKNKYFVASVLFLAWILFFDDDSIVSHIQNKRKLRELNEQKEYYKEQIVADKQKLEDLNSGIKELEKFAREQYHMSMPDEDVYIVVED
jgi:cell division protein FtsB